MAKHGRKPGAHFECDFIDDPRVHVLNSVQWTLYSKLWIMSVQCRRDVLCRSRWSLLYIASRSKLSRNSVPIALERLHNVGLIEMTGHYIKIKGVRKLHAKMDWREPFECCAKACSELPKTGLFIETLHEREREPGREREREPKKKKKKKRAARSGKSTETDEFKRFYETVYPRKTARAVAWKAWEKATMNGATPADLLSAAKYYGEAMRGQGKEMTGMKHPATFINSEHWRDFVKGIPEGERVKGKDNDGQVAYTDADYDNLPEGF